MLLGLKTEVINSHKAKVNAWNRLITSPYTRQNENHYYMKQDQFDNAVAHLVWEYNLERQRETLNKTYLTRGTYKL